MTNSKTLILLTFFAISTKPLVSQVKIGDNPTSINFNSMLEMESTNKGLLPPRVSLNSASSVSPLSAPVAEGTIVYNDSGSLKAGYYFWAGTKWLAVINTNDMRTNQVLIKSATDFPAPVSGVITLLSNTLYVINGTILLVDKIDLNGSLLKGDDAINDKLVYSQTSGELFTGSHGGNIRNLTLVANGVGGKLFNLNGGGINTNFIVQNCYILGCNNIGNIENFAGTVYFQTIAFFNNTNGITFANDTNVIINNSLWNSTNSNTYEKFVGKFSIIQKINGAMKAYASNSAIGVDISGITSLVSGELKTVLFNGDGTYKLGTFSKQWEVESNGLRTEKDGVAGGNLYMTTPVQTDIQNINVAEKIEGLTTSANLLRFTMPVDNRLVYQGTKGRNFEVICSLTAIQNSSNKYFEFYIAKNGVTLPESRQEVKLLSSTDQGPVTLSCVVYLEPGDYIEAWTENITSTTDVTVQTMNLSIK